ncbi:MAG TPA: flagellin [Candidatus Acidoferrales bacterium]|nr:flagellin [Candidatus Acidoferrales bacterium]
MAFSIQTNVNSLIAQENLRVNSNFQSMTIQRLTSGYRINSSGDDAAGLAVANKFRSDIAELTQGVRNSNDGVSQLQIIDGGMNNISKMLDRLKTLATQSSSDSFTGDRNTLNSEYQGLVTEIDRQAQSIGLNQGGSFAKNLSVFIGGGTGTTSSAALANGVVSVDLSHSMVDSQSLGLKGVRVANQNVNPSLDYDLSAASPTSVQAILGDPANKASIAGSTAFTFTGPGFGDSNGITVNVNLNGVGDTASLVTAINSAIGSAANLPGGANASFKAATIKASVVTDAMGKTQLAFDSPNAAFQVRADDPMANALIGELPSVVLPAGKAIDLTQATDASVSTGTFSANDTITVNVGGKNASVFMTGAGGVTPDNAASFELAFNSSASMKALGMSVSDIGPGTPLTFHSATGQSFSITASAVDTNLTLGTDLSGTTIPLASATSSLYNSFIAGGANELTNTAGTLKQDLSWANLGALDKQAITISGNDSSGGAHPITVNLANSITDTSGASIDAAINAINTALQKSNDPTLQQITAVKTAGAVPGSNPDTINFISTLKVFSVSAGLATNAANGLKDGTGKGFTYQAAQIGSGSAADISTAAGALTAVAAITSAVTMLGTAQAAVGKGQNQLGYAIGLAQSQISNFSAAQAQIRDADVAAEAANLSKAQVLQQASIAAMAQANSAPQAVLALLKG